MELKICHLYPDVLNLYGDRGNILCLRRRLEWRGLGFSLTELPLGGAGSLGEFDLVFIGGGQDFEQTVLLEDLRRGRGEDIRSAVEDGTPFLCVCGGYQLLGRSYRTADGQECPYIGALDLYTLGSEDRLIGNYVFQLEPEDGGSLVIGFENHGGRTYLGSGVRPLGRIRKGNGNNGEDGTEGAGTKTYSARTATVLFCPKTQPSATGCWPGALERKYGRADLEPLEDAAEEAARAGMLARLGAD